MLGTFQQLALVHNKLKFHMYARTLHTLMHIQHEDMPSNTGPPVERCAILTADFFVCSEHSNHSL